MDRQWVDNLIAWQRLEKAERDSLLAVETRVRRFESGQTLQFEDDEAPCLHVVEAGWAAAVRELIDGSVQILDLFLPGQIIGLREVASADTVSSCRALTEMTVRTCRKDAVMDVIDRWPAIGEQMFRMIALEEAWLLERIACLGQCDAAHSITHLLLELADRLALAAGDPGPRDFDLPLTQEQIGSIVGVTSVHVSRTVTELERKGLLSIHAGRVHFENLAGCEAFAEYDRRRMRIDHAPDR